MSFCTFADGAAMFDATPIENLFLTEYMYEAPAAALKVYLYARMLALHPELGGTLSDMAKALRIGEEEVYDAFTYWERRGLMRRLTDQPPTYAFQPMRAPAPAASSALDREMYANRDFNSRLRKLFNDQFIGDHELRKAADWQSILKFEQDAILRMVAYGIEKSPRKNPKPPSVFKRVDDMAEAWSKKGIRTLEDVERAIAEETGEAGLAREALKKLGIYRDPSQPELELVRRWTGEWGYDREAILAACDKTTNAQKPTLKYLDSILERQREEGQSFYADVAAVLRELTPGSTIPSPDQLAQAGGGTVHSGAGHGLHPGDDGAVEGAADGALTRRFGEAPQPGRPGEVPGLEGAPFRGSDPVRRRVRPGRGRLHGLHGPAADPVGRGRGDHSGRGQGRAGGVQVREGPH